MMLPRCLALLLGAALSCGGGDEAVRPEPDRPPEPASVVVTPETVMLDSVGEKVQLTARVLDRGGRELSDVTVTWRSSMPHVAVVHTSGLVAAMGNGTATITAASGGASGFATITVDDPRGIPSDRAILVAFYNATGGGGWRNRDNWASAAPLGAWAGVWADRDERVTILLLRENGLRGPLPPELGWLSKLARLDLHANALSGIIPPELGSLTSLRKLVLGGWWRHGRSTLSGPIPPELGNLRNLTDLRLTFSGLTGPIPPQLGDLANLEELYLNQNRLSGPIPPELGDLANLKKLVANANRLSGPIPPEFGNLGVLEELSFRGNDLSGPIPPALGNLVELYLSQNDLSGSIPPELGNLGALGRLSLYDNDLSGPIPPEFGNLGRLALLGLAENPRLAGPLPSTMTRLNLMWDLDIGGTELCVPRDTAFDRWLAQIRRFRGNRCAP